MLPVIFLKELNNLLKHIKIQVDDPPALFQHRHKNRRRGHGAVFQRPPDQSLCPCHLIIRYGKLRLQIYLEPSLFHHIIQVIHNFLFNFLFPIQLLIINPNGPSGTPDFPPGKIGSINGRRSAETVPVNRIKSRTDPQPHAGISLSLIGNKCIVELLQPCCRFPGIIAGKKQDKLIRYDSRKIHLRFSLQEIHHIAAVIL